MATITGYDNSNDRLEGTTDGDMISGLSGNDTLIGGAGQDTLYGGDGDDFIDTAGYAGGYSSKSQDDVVDGGSGYDTVQLDYSDLVWVSTQKPISLNLTFSTATFQIQIQGYVGATIAGCEAMNISMADGNDFAQMGAGDDYVAADGGNDTVKAGAGDDYVSDTTGRFDFDGGAGIDTIAFNWSQSTSDLAFDMASGKGKEDGVKLGAAIGFEVLYAQGGSGSDNFTGGAYGDTIYAAGGNNTVSGLGGDDVISTFDGADKVTGGDGNDSITTSTGADTVDAGAGADFVDTGAGADNILGGDGNDILYGGDGFIAESDTIDGGAGDDIVRLGANDAFGAGAAVVTGGAGMDTLYWTGGFKAPGTLDLSGGSASVPGGGSISGFEVYYIGGSTGPDHIIGAALDDTLNGSTGRDTLEGRDGNDVLIGSSDKDSIEGGAGNDTIYGFVNFYDPYDTDEGNTLHGGVGDDIIYAQAKDAVDGGDGYDKLSYGFEIKNAVELNLKHAGNPGAIIPVVNVESVQGSALGDHIIGSDGADSLDGYSGVDTLIGGKGNDTIWGGGGYDADDITLGKGRDTLVLYSLYDSGDRVRDFDPTQDHIRLDAFSRVLAPGRLDSGHFTSGDFGGSPVATGAGTQIMYDTSDGHLYIDWDGTGSSYGATLVAMFDGTPSITASDFIVSTIG